MFALLVSLCLIAPVSGPIVAPFVPPACPRCPGNVAVDYASEPGEIVRVPVGGVVHFAGSVGGRVYVTVRAGHHLVTVGGIDELVPGLSRGRAVRSGQILGSARGPVDPVSLSVRDSGGIHLDPTPFVGRWAAAGPRSRLVPIGGSVSRPGPRAVCRVAG